MNLKKRQVLDDKRVHICLGSVQTFNCLPCNLDIILQCPFLNTFRCDTILVFLVESPSYLLGYTGQVNILWLFEVGLAQRSILLYYKIQKTELTPGPEQLKCMVQDTEDFSPFLKYLNWQEIIPCFRIDFHDAVLAANALKKLFIG